MTKSENIQNPLSCLNRASDDEPLFILRAHDPLAPEIIRAWADDRREARGAGDEQALDAERIAGEMERWKRKHG